MSVVAIIVGLAWLVIAHFFLIFTNPEYAKHDRSAWGFIQLIKFAWPGFVLTIGGWFTYSITEDEI
jgi:hypothetical protein